MPFVMLLTGISGSGKTTLARAVAKALMGEGRSVEVIDGDETRHMIGDLFGYTREDRSKMAKVNRVIGHYLLKNGISVIYALVAPFEEIRRYFREAFGGQYAEVYVSASRSVCAARDVKGLYKLANEGKVDNLNGTNSGFEEPNSCDLVIDTEHTSVEEACDICLRYIKEHTNV